MWFISCKLIKIVKPFRSDYITLYIDISLLTHFDVLKAFDYYLSAHCNIKNKNFLAKCIRKLLLTQFNRTHSNVFFSMHAYNVQIFNFKKANIKHSVEERKRKRETKKVIKNGIVDIEKISIIKIIKNHEIER